MVRTLFIFGGILTFRHIYNCMNQINKIEETFGVIMKFYSCIIYIFVKSVYAKKDSHSALTTQTR
jgi:hypothetical protein